MASSAGAASVRRLRRFFRRVSGKLPHNLVGVTDDHVPLAQILQLPDVARPRIAA